MLNSIFQFIILFFYYLFISTFLVSWEFLKYITGDIVILITIIIVIIIILAILITTFYLTFIFVYLSYYFDLILKELWNGIVINVLNGFKMMFVLLAPLASFSSEVALACIIAFWDAFCPEKNLGICIGPERFFFLFQDLAKSFAIYVEIMILQMNAYQSLVMQFICDLLIYQPKFQSFFCAKAFYGFNYVEAILVNDTFVYIDQQFYDHIFSIMSIFASIAKFIIREGVDYVGRTVIFLLTEFLIIEKYIAIFGVVILALFLSIITGIIYSAFPPGIDPAYVGHNQTTSFDDMYDVMQTRLTGQILAIDPFRVYNESKFPCPPGVCEVYEHILLITNSTLYSIYIHIPMIMMWVDSLFCTLIHLRKCGKDFGLCDLFFSPIDGYLMHFLSYYIKKQEEAYSKWRYAGGEAGILLIEALLGVFNCQKKEGTVVHWNPDHLDNGGTTLVFEGADARFTCFGYRVSAAIWPICALLLHHGHCLCWACQISQDTLGEIHEIFKHTLTTTHGIPCNPFEQYEDVCCISKSKDHLFWQENCNYQTGASYTSFFYWIFQLEYLGQADKFINLEPIQCYWRVGTHVKFIDLFGKYYSYYYAINYNENNFVLNIYNSRKFYNNIVTDEFSDNFPFDYGSNMELHYFLTEFVEPAAVSGDLNSQFAAGPKFVFFGYDVHPEHQWPYDLTPYDPYSPFEPPRGTPDQYTIQYNTIAHKEELVEALKVMFYSFSAGCYGPNFLHYYGYIDFFHDNFGREDLNKVNSSHMDIPYLPYIHNKTYESFGLQGWDDDLPNNAFMWGNIGIPKQYSQFTPVNEAITVCPNYIKAREYAYQANRKLKGRKYWFNRVESGIKELKGIELFEALTECFYDLFHIDNPQWLIYKEQYVRQSKLHKTDGAYSNWRFSLTQLRPSVVIDLMNKHRFEYFEHVHEREAFIDHYNAIQNWFTNHIYTNNFFIDAIRKKYCRFFSIDPGPLSAFTHTEPNCDNIGSGKVWLKGCNKYHLATKHQHCYQKYKPPILIPKNEVSRQCGNTPLEKIEKDGCFEPAEGLSGMIYLYGCDKHLKFPYPVYIGIDDAVELCKFDKFSDLKSDWYDTEPTIRCEPTLWRGYLGAERHPGRFDNMSHTGNKIYRDQGRVSLFNYYYPTIHGLPGQFGNDVNNTFDWLPYREGPGSRLPRIATFFEQCFIILNATIRHQYANPETLESTDPVFALRPSTALSNFAFFFHYGSTEEAANYFLNNWKETEHFRNNTIGDNFHEKADHVDLIAKSYVTIRVMLEKYFLPKIMLNLLSDFVNTDANGYCYNILNGSVTYFPQPEVDEFRCFEILNHVEIFLKYFIKQNAESWFWLWIDDVDDEYPYNLITRATIIIPEILRDINTVLQIISDVDYFGNIYHNDYLLAANVIWQYLVMLNQNTTRELYNRYIDFDMEEAMKFCANGDEDPIYFSDVDDEFYGMELPKTECLIYMQSIKMEHEDQIYSDFLDVLFSPTTHLCSKILHFYENVYDFGMSATQMSYFVSHQYQVDLFKDMVENCEYNPVQRKHPVQLQEWNEI